VAAARPRPGGPAWQRAEAFGGAATLGEFPIALGEFAAPLGELSIALGEFAAPLGELSIALGEFAAPLGK